MQDPELSELAEFMTEFWQFIKKYYNAPDWPNLLQAAGELGRKHNNLFAISQINAFLNYAESRQKQEEKEREKKNEHNNSNG